MATQVCTWIEDGHTVSLEIDGDGVSAHVNCPGPARCQAKVSCGECRILGWAQEGWAQAFHEGSARLDGVRFPAPIRWHLPNDREGPEWRYADVRYDDEITTGGRGMSGIWSCKIGEVDRSAIEGERNPDEVMRRALSAAYEAITGRPPEFIFSGWGAELDETERAVVEDRMPRTEALVLHQARCTRCNATLDLDGFEWVRTPELAVEVALRHEWRRSGKELLCKECVPQLT